LVNNFDVNFTFNAYLAVSFANIEIAFTKKITKLADKICGIIYGQSFVNNFC
jgi:hypothetical protein